MAEFLKTEEPPDYLDDMLTEARASLPPRVHAWLSSLRPSWRSGQVLFVHAGVNPRSRTRSFSCRSLEHSARQARRRSSLGLGAPAVPRASPGAGRLQRLLRRPRPHAERRASATPRTPIRSRGYRLNLDAGSAMTGIAKMAIIRDRYAEVVSARGPTKRELMGDGSRCESDGRCGRASQACDERSIANSRRNRAVASNKRAAFEPLSLLIARSLGPDRSLGRRNKRF